MSVRVGVTKAVGVLDGVVVRVGEVVGVAVRVGVGVRDGVAVGSSVGATGDGYGVGGIMTGTPCGFISHARTSSVRSC